VHQVVNRWLAARAMKRITRTTDPPAQPLRCFLGPAPSRRLKPGIIRVDAKNACAGNPLDLPERRWSNRCMCVPLSRGRLGAAARIGGVALLLFLLLGLGLAASSLELHKLICPKAGQADDFCVVKQFQGGMVETPLVEPVAVALPCTLAFVLCWGGEVFRAAPLFRLSPARAPPSGFLVG
jgi:hypothetical protein